MIKSMIDAGYNERIATILCNRGIDTPDKAKAYFEYGKLHDALTIKDMSIACDIIEKHHNDLVGIMGDYDVDGITATAVMVIGLSNLGYKVISRLPDRISEGYGMSNGAVKELFDKGCKLLVTVDNGISCHEQIEYAKSLGMDVVVTDHHTVDTIPPADAVIDLHRTDETYPYRELAGCGVAFKVVCALYARANASMREAFNLIDLVAIGTVADVVPLTGENRNLVKYGVREINSNPRTGVQAIMSVANRNTITSTDISFGIAPMINAGGRMIEKGAELAYMALTSTDMEEAIKYATKICELNEERKQITEKYVKEAEDYIENSANNHFLVVLLPTCPTGIIGLVAGRLAEKYYRPTLVFTCTEKGFKASGRTNDKVNIYNLIYECKDLMVKFGGHAKACGLTVATEKDVKELEKRLNELTDKYYDETAFNCTDTYDCELNMEDVSVELYEQLECLEPFGEANPMPVFKINEINTRLCKDENGNYEGYRKMGKEKNHLKLNAYHNDNPYNVVGFTMAEEYEKQGKPRTISALVNIGINDYLGDVQVQILLRKFNAVVKVRENAMRDRLQSLL